MIVDGQMVFLWVGFGVAAGLVAGILPYRRSGEGIATNFLLGILGAILGGLIGRAIFVHHPTHDPMGIALSAIFAVITLAMFHTLWIIRYRRR